MKEAVHLLTPRETPQLLSVVVPVYNEEAVLPLLAERLSGVMAKLPCAAEVIFVNDGSFDQTLRRLQELVQSDSRFRVVCLARNFGHQLAATAGLDCARGDAVVLMDADLQDPPELILEMIGEYCKGYDVVYAQRAGREGESFFKRSTAWAFYRLMRALTGTQMPSDVGDFRLLSRRCLQTLAGMRETHRFLRGMVSWVGFPQTAVRFVRPPRAAGTTKYSLWKMLRFAWTAAVSFSPVPLRLTFLLGSCLLGTGVIYGIYALVRQFLGLYLVPGWTSLVILVCLTGGAIMISIGILGEYVARVFEEIKGRPLYVVSDRLNFPE